MFFSIDFGSTLSSLFDNIKLLICMFQIFRLLDIRLFSFSLVFSFKFQVMTSSTFLKITYIFTIYFDITDSLLSLQKYESLNIM